MRRPGWGTPILCVAVASLFGVAKLWGEWAALGCAWAYLGAALVWMLWKSRG